MSREPSPRNPSYEATVRKSFAQQGLMVTLGARLGRVAPGRIEIDLPSSPGITQQQGLIHGGAVGAIADSAAGYAALSLLAPGQDVVTIEYKINFLRGATGPLIRAVGDVVRAGRTITVVDARVFGGLALDGTGDGVEIARLQATMMAIGN